jgi:hypothetical protein
MKTACHLKAWCMLLPLFLHGWLMGCCTYYPLGPTVGCPALIICLHKTSGRNDQNGVNQ